MVENESISGEGLELFWWFMLPNMPGAIVFFLPKCMVFFLILTICKEMKEQNQGKLFLIFGGQCHSF
jgi:hypothetical protein